ncbi:hypothetical protein CYMTET_54424 [Cymbomonas tetramitiformis]|uniref:Gamma carbonic anhydrase n=1 Tax=Cymbomonas tetramitiformis TaxID=36881 RepID=A0AAE0BGB5_9CHLO|nr:hypothetical protein CYMTET_54424 [Cymbomonas tetramitiformis]
MAFLGRTCIRSLQNATRQVPSLKASSVFGQQSLGRMFSANPIEDEVYCRQRTAIPLGPRVPFVSATAWIAPNATVIGDVDIIEGASIWYGAVLRGDLNHIQVGAHSSIQDKAVIHAARSSPTGVSAATIIGAYVTVGAGSVIRSATVGDYAVIGKKCIVMEGSLLEKNSVLEDGAVVPPGSLIPSGQVWGGIPAAYVRDLTEEEGEALENACDSTSLLASDHKYEFLKYGTAHIEAEELKEKLASA